MHVRDESELNRQIEMAVATVARLSKEHKVSQEAAAKIVGDMHRADTAFVNATKLTNAINNIGTLISDPRFTDTGIAEALNNVASTIEEIALSKKG